jgi:hypothetical protein
VPALVLIVVSAPFVYLLLEQRSEGLDAPG